MNLDASSFAEDLNWLRQCPSLLIHAREFPWNSIAPPLPSQELDFSEAEQFRAGPRSYQVGSYVESLVHASLSSANKIGGIRHGIQIREEKLTLGELDFLFDWEGGLHHLEVALKLFLYSPDHRIKGSHFIGPNAADTFERKRDKLIRKQLPFGKRSFPEIDQSHLMMKGLIFYHPDLSMPSSLPPGMNPRHQRGTWIRANELADYLDRRPDLIPAIMEKPFWLGPPVVNETAPPLRPSETVDLRFPMLISLQAETRTGRQEHERVMVVPEEWPLNL